MPQAQREVVQRVFQRIAVTDDRVTDVDLYPVYAESHRIGDPERTRGRKYHQSFSNTFDSTVYSERRPALLRQG